MTWIPPRRGEAGLAKDRSSTSAGNSEASTGHIPVSPVLQQRLADLPDKGNIRLDEVAAHFDISVDLVLDCIANGKLTAVRISTRNRRLPCVSLFDYILKYVLHG